MRRAHVVVVLGSVTYTALLLLTSLATGATILMAFWRPLHARLAIARGWARLQIALLQRLCGLSYTVEGVENLPAGAHVALWKHSSAWETIAQMLILPPQVWVLKRELLWLPVIGWATRLLAPIAINRAGAGTAVSQVVTQGGVPSFSVQ